MSAPFLGLLLEELELPHWNTRVMYLPWPFYSLLVTVMLLPLVDQVRSVRSKNTISGLRRNDDCLTRSCSASPTGCSDPSRQTGSANHRFGPSSTRVGATHTGKLDPENVTGKNQSALMTSAATRSGASSFQ